MANNKKVGVHGTDEETGRAPKKHEKAECLISEEEFLANAKPIVIDVMGQTVVLQPRKFSTGSFGWHIGEKVTITVAQLPLKVQFNIGGIVVGSKDLKKKE